MPPSPLAASLSATGFSWLSPVLSASPAAPSSSTGRSRLVTLPLVPPLFAGLAVFLPLPCPIMMFGVIAPLLLLVAILLPLTVPLPVSIALPLAITLVITAALIVAPFLATLPMMMVTLVSSPPAVLVHRLVALVLLRGLMYADLLVPLMFTAAASRTGASVRSFVPLRRLGTFRSVPSAIRTIPIGPILTCPGRGRTLAVART
uniref:Uncharacterized protein n=1 Tax=Anopheles merus TaxID=30066 RepID=A0A182V8G5_ANOME